MCALSLGAGWLQWQGTPCQRLQMKEQWALELSATAAPTYTALCAIGKGLFVTRNTAVYKVPILNLKLYKMFTECNMLDKLLPFNFMLILLVARRYCPLCFQTHWLSFIGKCKILSFKLWGLFQLCMQWVGSMHNDILTKFRAIKYSVCWLALHLQQFLWRYIQIMKGPNVMSYDMLILAKILRHVITFFNCFLQPT